MEGVGITLDTIRASAEWHGQQCVDFYRSASGTKNKYDREGLEERFRYHGRMHDYLQAFIQVQEMPLTIVALRQKWKRR